MAQSTDGLVIMLRGKTSVSTLKDRVFQRTTQKCTEMFVKYSIGKPEACKNQQSI